MREAVSWRSNDLLPSRSRCTARSTVWERAPLRSAFEPLATLIHLNQLMGQVVDGGLDFHDFDRTTRALALGSRDGATRHQSLNIVTVLDKADRRYPGLKPLYGRLSESAHPNFEGMIAGYSKLDHDARETRFSNRWMQRHGAAHLGAMDLCMTTFVLEHNHVWAAAMTEVEGWIARNDDALEAAKPPEASDRRDQNFHAVGRNRRGIARPRTAPSPRRRAPARAGRALGSPVLLKPRDPAARARRALLLVLSQRDQHRHRAGHHPAVPRIGVPHVVHARALRVPALVRDPWPGRGRRRQRRVRHPPVEHPSIRDTPSGTGAC